MIDIEREREAETQEEGEAGSMPGAGRGTQSRDSRIAPWAKGRRQTAEPPRDPLIFFLRFYLFMIDIERERGRDTGRGRSRLHARSPMWDSIPKTLDHTLNGRQTLNPEPPRHPKMMRL